MAGGTLSIINGGINTIAPYDLDIEPDISNVTGGTIQFGLSGAAKQTFRFQTSVPLWNFTLDATTNASAIQETYNSTLLGSLISAVRQAITMQTGLTLKLAGIS